MLFRLGICALALVAALGVALIDTDDAQTAGSWKENIILVAPLQMKTSNQLKSNERMERENASRPRARRLPVPPPPDERGKPRCPDEYCSIPSGYLKIDLTGSYYKGNNNQYDKYVALRSRAKTPRQQAMFFRVKNNPYRFITSNCSAYTSWVIDRATQGRVQLLTPLASTQFSQVVSMGGTNGRFSSGSAPTPPPPGGFRAGDLVFFNTYDMNGDGTLDPMTHVGIMVTPTDMFHSGTSGNGVVRVNLRQYIKKINADGLTAYGWARLPDRFR